MFVLYTVRDASAEAREYERNFARRLGMDLSLRAPLRAYPEGSPGFHVFLSHQWTHAQDQVAVIKHMLVRQYPGFRAFLE